MSHTGGRSTGRQRQAFWKRGRLVNGADVAGAGLAVVLMGSIYNLRYTIYAPSKQHERAGFANSAHEPERGCPTRSSFAWTCAWKVREAFPPARRCG
jgi:hypothetical protein